MQKILIIVTSLFLHYNVIAQEATKNEVSARSSYEKAQSDVKEGNYDNAFEHINAALEKSPANISYLTFKAVMILKHTHAKEEALPLLDQVILKNTLSGKAFYFRGIANRHTDNTESSCEDFKKAAGLDYPLAEETYSKYCITNITEAFASSK